MEQSINRINSSGNWSTGIKGSLQKVNINDNTILIPRNKTGQNWTLAVIKCNFFPKMCVLTMSYYLNMNSLVNFPGYVLAYLQDYSANCCRSSNLILIPRHYLIANMWVIIRTKSNILTWKVHDFIHKCKFVNTFVSIGISKYKIQARLWSQFPFLMNRLPNIHLDL